MTDPAVVQEYLDLMFRHVSQLVDQTSEQLLPTKKRHHNYLGDDVDRAMLKKIEQCGRPERETGLPPWEEAQARELAFWRWLAFEGYGGRDPRTFRAFQSQLMLRSFMKTGWSMAQLTQQDVVEIGCGPLGMIEYLPARRRVGFDPLNQHYARLFSKVRSPDIDYVDDFDALVERSPASFDVAICFNVLDHTEEPRPIFDGMMRMLRPGGRFLLQVNTVRDGFPRTRAHERMHPSPFTEAAITAWIAEVCDAPAVDRTDTPSADNEFWFMSWGRKDRSV